MLKLNLQYFLFQYPIGKEDSLEKPCCWGRLKAKEKRVAEDKIIRPHHRLNGHEFEQTLGSQRVGHDSATGEQQNSYHCVNCNNTVRYGHE